MDIELQESNAIFHNPNTTYDRKQCCPDVTEPKKTNILWTNTTRCDVAKKPRDENTTRVWRFFIGQKQRFAMMT